MTAATGPETAASRRAHAWLCVADDRRGLEGAIDALRDEVTARGELLLAGAWTRRDPGPFDGFIPVARELVSSCRGDGQAIVERYQKLLVSLVPDPSDNVSFAPAPRSDGSYGSYGANPRLPVADVRPFHSRLSDLVLHRDGAGLPAFFRKRDVQNGVVAELVRFLCEAAAHAARAAGAPVTLRFAHVQRADPSSLRALALLSRYGPASGLSLWIGAVRPAPETLTALDAQWPGWRRAMAAGAGSDQRAPDDSAEGDTDRETGDADRAPGDAGVDRPRAYRAAIAAMQRAWGLGAYDCAQREAKRAIELRRAPDCADCGDFDDRLLLAMLAYEAGDHEAAQAHLTALADAAPTGEHYTLVDSGEDDTTLLRHFLGHNAIFGLGRYQAGIEHMTAALSRYERAGLDRHASYVRNAIAFALLRTRSLDEVIEWERATLADVRASRPRDPFIESILQLNLSRLHHAQGDLDRAIESLRAMLADPDLERIPAVTLLCRAKLGYYYFLQKQDRAALREFSLCLDLCPLLALDNLDGDVLSNLGGLMRRALGPVGDSAVLPGDRALLFAHYNLAAAAHRLGLRDAARACGAHLARHLRDLGHASAERVQGAIADAQRTGLARTAAAARAVAAHEETDAEFEAEADAEFEAETDAEFEAEADAALAAVADVVCVRDRSLDVVVEHLLAGAVVWVAPRYPRIGACAPDALVLCDPRDARGATAFRGTGPLRWCLALAGARALVPTPSATPYLLQRCSVHPAARADLTGLTPTGGYARAIAPTWEPSLHALLAGFSARTGYGVVACAPLRDGAHDVAIDLQGAVRLFLSGPLEHMVLGSKWVTKRYGAQAEENLLPLRPRLSSYARFFTAQSHRGGFCVAADAPFHSRKPRYVALDARLRPLLEQCDGTRTLAAILDATRGLLGAGDVDAPVCALMRRLYLERVVTFA